MKSLIGGMATLIKDQGSPLPFGDAPRIGSAFTQMFAGRNGAEAQMKAMGSVGTLFGIVNRTSTATSQVEWKLYRPYSDGRRRYGPTDDDQQRIEVTKHVALDILNKPNPFTTRQELFEAGQQHIDLTGEGWVIISYLDKAHKVPGELWGPIRPDKMQPVPHPTKFLAGYVYTGPHGEKIPLDLDEVIFIRMPNPLDAYRGMGPVQSVLTDLDASTYSAEWNRNFFLNSAEPGGIIQVDATLSDPEFEKLRMRWNEQHRGVSKAHRVAILEHGQFTPLGYSQRDMQFAQLRTVSRDTILEAFGMPKSMLGITENVNRANAETGEVTFGRWMTVPRLERWKLALNNDFLPKFGASAAGLEFDYVNPIPESREEENADLTARTGAFSVLVTAGVSSSAAAEVCGLPDMEMEPKPVPPPAAPPPPPGSEPPASPQPEEPPSGQAARAHSVQRPAARAVTPEGDEPPHRRVNLAPVAAAYAKRLAALLKKWGDVTAGQIDSLVDQVRDLVTNDNLAGLPAMTAPTDDAHAELLAAMVAIGAEAGEQVRDEARDQDVAGVAPVPPAHDTLSKAASVIVGLLATGLVNSAAGEAWRQAGANQTPAAVADAVRSFLNSLTDAQPTQRLGAGLHSAQHAGRVATLAGAESNPQITQSVEYYASEVNDVNTCGPCSEEDGRDLGSSIGDALTDYPTGGFIDCEGRDRCRGQIVAVWTIGESE